MVQYRDIIQRQENKFEKKQDKKGYIKAVVTDALGNTSGAGDIWYDRNTRRVWIQENGSASLSQVPCYKITPAIGLGVIVGYEPYSTVREVLATDREFYGPTNSTGTSYESPSDDDFLPGGRLQLWLDPRLFQPLAIYPDDTGLVINIVAGDYPYAGTRKTFSGQVSYNISAYQPAGPNEHCLVGLYLDSANSLQVVAGATVSTAVTAPEPTWPSGAFLLSVVLLDDTQTSISFVDDIFDRRLPWSDTNALGVPLTGAIITGDATPEWTVLPRGAAGQYVTPNSTTGVLEWRDIPTVGITEFLYHDASDIATYFQMKTDIPTGGVQTLTSAAVAASNTEIFDFATNSGQPAVEFINDGVWHLHLHAQKSGPGTKNVTLKFRAYYRTDPGGVETQIGTGYSESTGNLTTSAAEYDVFFVLPETTIAITDRLVLKIYADISGAGVNPTVTLTMEGTTDTRLEIPALVSGTGGDKGWPVAGKAMINNVEYDTIQLAIDAMASGDIIKVGQGTDTGGIIPDTAGSIVGLSPVETIITASANDSITVDNSAGTDNLTLENLTISNTGAGTSVACIQSNKDGLRLDNLDIKKVSGTPTNSTGVSVYGGSAAGTYLLNCRVSVTTGTNKYGVYTSTAANVVVIEGGEINAATADIYIGHASSVVELRGPKLLGGGINNASGGTVKGWYIDAYGRVVRIEPIKINNARLTLTSGTPVTTADVSAATTVYAALYKGNTVELFNGGGWIEANYTEKSIKTTDTQTGTTHNGTMVIDGLTDTSQLIVGMEISGTGVGAASTIASIDSATQVTGTVNSTADGTVSITFKIPASKNVDVFMFDNAGTPKLEFSPLWTDATTRATALTTQDGRYVKSGATTRLYLGTICTTTTAGQTEDSLLRRFVWNYYNRCRRRLSKDASGSHSYNGGWRFWNNSSANTVEFVIGVLEDVIDIICQGDTSAGGSTVYGYIGAGLNSSSTPVTNGFAYGTVANIFVANHSYPVVGYNYLSIMEQTASTGSSTFNNASLIGVVEG